jgi:Ni/Fe-hydrogenase 1 B-type cytochrome subunit
MASTRRRTSLRPTRVSVWDLRNQERSQRERHSIYVWQLPVRIAHWTIVGTLLVLAATGYFIHHPFLGPSPGALAPGQEPGFLMGTVRAVHVGAGFVFLAALIGRFYWAFVGNEWANWRAYWPIESWQRRDLRATLRYYALLRREPPPATGHNPLAGLAYVALYAGLAVAALTGLSLYAWLYDTGPWTFLFGWTYDVLPIAQIRLVHFVLMFWFIAFAVHHVYSATLIDIEEQNGELSSMVTGWKVEHWQPSAAEPPEPGDPPS